MQDPKISLSIGGTIKRGWESICALNLPPIALEYSTKGSLQGLYYFELVVHPTCTQYTLVQQGVVTGEGRPDGVLKISIMIPANYQIKGATAYNVLIDVYNAFKQHNLDVTASTYRFKGERVDESIFLALLNNFQLEPYNGPHRVMSGVDYALLVTPQSMMDQLFSDVQYPEFMPFKEIVVAEGGYATNMLSHIAIPRKRVMTVSLNGNPVLDPRFAQIDSSRFAEQLTLDWCTLAGQSDVCFENYRWQFSVNDLLNGARYENVTVDFSNEVIKLSHVARPRQRRITVEVSGANPSSVLPGLSVNKQTPMNGVVVLQGEECLLRDMAVIVSPTTGYELVDKQMIGDMLMLTVRKHNRPISNFGGSGFDFDPYQNPNQPTTIALELRIEGKGAISNSEDQYFRVTIKNRGANKSVVQDVYFQPKGGNRYMSESIELSPKMLSSGQLYITCENKKYCTIDAEGQCVSVNRNSGVVGVIVKQRSFYELHKGLVWAMLALLLLVSAGLIGLFIWAPWKDPYKDYRAQMEVYNHALTDSNLAFDKVEEIYHWYESNIVPIYHQEPDQVISNDIARITEYHKVVEYLTYDAQEPDKKAVHERVKKLITEINNLNNIHGVHRDYLQLLCEPLDKVYPGHAGNVPANELYWTYEVCNSMGSFTEIDQSKPNVGSNDYNKACNDIYVALYGPAKKKEPKPVGPRPTPKDPRPTPKDPSPDPPTSPGGFKRKR